MAGWFLAVVLAAAAFAGSRGVAGSEIEGDIYVFDPLGREIVRVLDLPSGFVGDCVVDGDSRRGFVGKGTNEIWRLDLASVTPTWASGTNPVTVQGPGDLALTDDDAYLLACGTAQAVVGCRVGSASQVVTVVDTTDGSIVDEVDLGVSCCAVETCSDGSVLVAVADPGPDPGRVRRLTIDGAGQLTDSGEFGATTDYPFNLSCAPDAGTVAVSLEDGSVASYAVDGLVLLDSQDAYQEGTVVVHEGDDVFVRHAGSIRRYAFDPMTGTFGPLVLTIGTQPDSFLIRPGIDTLVVSTFAGITLSTGGQNIRVGFIENGAQGSWIFVPSFNGFTGLCIGDLRRLHYDGFETGDLRAWFVPDR